MNGYPRAGSSGDLNRKRKALERNRKTRGKHGRIMAVQAHRHSALPRMKFRQSVGMKIGKHGLSEKHIRFAAPARRP
jgi:hypothetical protein